MSKWIKCTESLPYEDEIVWCYWRGREVLLAQYNGDDMQGSQYGFYSFEDCKVRWATHWCRLEDKPPAPLE